MKHKNSCYSTLLEAFRDGNLGKYLSIILVLAFLNTLGGCYYYKVVTSEDPPDKVIRTQQEAEKFFIMHSGDQALRFSNITVSDNTIQGIISPLPGHQYYKTTSTKHANRYKVRPKQDERAVINEVHITVSEYNTTEGNEITISPENIEKIEIYDRASGATTASWVFGGLGIVVLAGGALLAFFGLAMLISGGGE